MKVTETGVAWGAIVAFVFLAAVGVVLGINFTPPLPPPTPEQIKATDEQRAREAQRSQEARLENDRRRAELRAELERKAKLCDIRSLCSKYGQARQRCALAGNISECIEIKMEAEARGFYPCMNNGDVFGSPKDMPEGVACFFLGSRIWEWKW